MLEFDIILYVCIANDYFQFQIITEANGASKSMNVEELREYCLSLKGATESFPFDELTLVLKVQGKMFALIPLDSLETRISMKCDPEKAIALREKYSAIIPAWHFNKKYWNTVIIDHTISKILLCALIQDSYDLVVSGLPKRLREELN